MKLYKNGIIRNQAVDEDDDPSTLWQSERKLVIKWL